MLELILYFIGIAVGILITLFFTNQSMAATHDVSSVTIRTWFYLEEDSDTPQLYEFTMNRYEWKAYLRSHTLARCIPFSCAAYWMGPDLEDLMCGFKPERYTKIQARHGGMG